jgi:DNA-binding NarL/FixJ family response regulator
MVAILLVEDHQVVRQGLHFLLEHEADFHIVGETGDGLQAVQLAEQLKPAVLVLDLILPGLNGLEVARQVKQRLPQTQIVILSMYADMGYVLQALNNGVSAYVVKNASATHLVQAVRAALAGQHYFSPPLSAAVVQDYAEKTQSGALDPYETLTTREREVLNLAAEGLTVPEIGSRLAISPRTAESHRANLMRKLHLHTQTDLVRYALHHGILPHD